MFKSVNARIPIELYNYLKESAQAGHRSITQQIIKLIVDEKGSATDYAKKK